MMADENAKLIRGLTLTDATSLVVRTIIGTGIFLKTALAEGVPAPVWKFFLSKTFLPLYPLLN